MTTRITVLVAANLLATSAGLAQGPIHLPQTFNPAVAELGSWDDVPFMRPNARVQCFYGGADVPASFSAGEIAFRYDGPIPRVGAAGPFAIQRLRVNAGTTTVASPDATFATNLSAPLTNVFDGPVSFLPDPGSQTPDVWGGPQGSLRFPFRSTLLVNVPSNGWFVVELQLEGNDIDGRTHALLDAALAFGGPVDGSASSSGSGCASTPGGTPASVTTSGVHAPGAAHSVHGAGLGAGAPVAVLIGVSDVFSALGPLPFAVPGTSCTVYGSWDLQLNTLADASGTVPPFAPGSVVPVPANPALANLPLYEQLVSFVPGANPPWGLVFSDKRTVLLGSYSPPASGIYQASNKTSATAAFADLVRPLAYAIRLQ